MDGSKRLGPRWVAAILGLTFLAIVPGLGSARLSYHEAIVAQSAREMLVSGAWHVPTLDDSPWLEKPPLLHWLVLIASRVAGDVTELAARLPSGCASVLMAMAVATLGARQFGSTVGGLAGCVQALTSWTVIRGRLVESDMILACLIAWTIVALDRLREEEQPSTRKWLARAVWLGIGATSLAKGIGFGAALIVATTALIVTWDRNWPLLRSLVDLPGMAMALMITLAWPAMILARYPEALSLWTTHVADRLADRPEVFAGRASWWAYAPAVLGQTLPWTPLALVGAWSSWARACRERGGPDRLLWAWAVGPLVLLSLATIKNAHYAIHALGPWSVWAALGLVKSGDWLAARGRSRQKMRPGLAVILVAIAIAFGLGLGVLAPRLDRRSAEWSFYQTAARYLEPGEPLVLLYDDWDRLPYPTPFGPIPHDLAVRLYYLHRPATWREGVGHWPDMPTRRFAAIARDRDLEGLTRIGGVEKVVQGPPSRWDRTYSLYRVTPEDRRAETVARVNEIMK